MSEPAHMSYAEASRFYESLEARAAVRREALGSGRSRVRVPRLRVAGVVLACSAVAAAAVAVLVISGQPPTRVTATAGHHPTGGNLGRGIEGIPPVPIGRDPLPGGRSVTLDQASLLLGSPVPTPDSPLASAHNLTVAWAIHGEVMLDYVATQIRIRIVPANHILQHHTLRAFKREARADHMSPGAMTLDGFPALVVGGSQKNPGFAEVVRNGLDIAVMGHRSAAELIAIARSLGTGHRTR